MIVYGTGFDSLSILWLYVIPEYRKKTSAQDFYTRLFHSHIRRIYGMWRHASVILRPEEAYAMVNNDFNTNNVKLEDFVDAMGNAIDDNLIETARRVGYFWSYWHRNDLNMNE